ncbi:4-hydroxy-tetrahydrodipicolinate reductase [Myceligenerans pegani]|uniref:4-hydroxy-tetrahydrodipicolinate reductase n=1 Tax=Myceligenerans pegani TaxID=2776917 RepID=A0ABR9MV79_9MICO|nr:4-hydroxy-tetrahydrodipicolinate reductase [Myceligenerans sp. TRM 65318]MBE1874672.1 4-hydroxy-tetrahydrodipicolinate reductase [Myceligenerans sp. TRM 65318]MBE3016943.1 4-hydroxy-tetrahydrodipicolinate reductase [Myceligenerans sp. TRM 65318]
MTEIKVAVLGAAGRMGTQTCAAVEAADGMTLVARLDKDDPITGGSLSGADVVVDFTVPSAAEKNVHAVLDAGAHAVVGTTGWDDASRGRVAEHLERLNATRAHGLGVLIAPNFGLSAVLAMSFAAKAARWFESVEVIELHHPDKVDAPSGTARHTAVAVAAARAEAGLPASPDATESGWEARGADIDGVRVHAVRLRGLVAHEEILLGNPGEQLVIRQDSFDRSSFMPGVLVAVRAVVDRPGLTVGLEHVLDLA